MSLHYPILIKEFDIIKVLMVIGICHLSAVLQEKTCCSGVIQCTHKMRGSVAWLLLVTAKLNKQKDKDA